MLSPMLEPPPEAESTPLSLRAGGACWPWWVAGWCVAIVVASRFDERVADFFRDSGFAAWLKGSPLAEYVLKPPGVYWIAVASAAAAWAWSKRHRVAGALVILLSGWSGIATWLIKWLVGRPRPFWSFEQNRRVDIVDAFTFSPMEWDRLIKGSNLSFPSGHACMAFSTAAALAIVFPRLRWVFFGVASITAMERVAENAHYLSDSVAGAGVGIGCVHLMVAFWRKQILATGERIERLYRTQARGS